MPTRPHTRIALIDNSGVNQLLPYLRTAGNSCRQIDIAVAFITATGLESILHVLQKVARKDQVRILTGLYQGFTDPKALAGLLREQTATSGRLSVRISNNPRFHWKAYLLIDKGSATAIIGSSNMTSEGMTESGELNVVLTMRQDAKDFRLLHSVFEKNWDNLATPLNKRIIDEYRDWRQTQKPSARRAVPLKQILGSKTPSSHTSQPRPKKFWRLSCTGTLRDTTVSLLEELTDWDKQDLETLSTFTDQVRAGDEGVMFNTQSGWLSLVQIQEATQTPKRTPDGRYFIGYRMRPKSIRKRLTPLMWKRLRDAKMIRTKSGAQLMGKLPERQYRLFEELLSKQ
jgi:HKD family nuclease